MVANKLCKLHLGQHPPTFCASPPEFPPQTPFPLDEESKGNIIRSPGDSPEASVTYQSYGFGLGAVSVFSNVRFNFASLTNPIVL
jgi:hypothetical protein